MSNISGLVSEFLAAPDALPSITAACPLDQCLGF